jgi:3-methyladenine DNA glycosylase/8-oxoguanine DNA glycosylase
MSGPPDAAGAFARPDRYQFLPTLGVLALGAGDPTTRVAPGEVWRATVLPAGAVTVQLVDAGAELLVRAWGPGAAAALPRAPALLGLPDRPADFRPAHPVVARLAADFPGLHLVSTGEVVHPLARNVVRQLVTWPEARRTWRALALAIGAPAPGPGGLWLLPAPAALRDTPPAVFQRLGLGRRQADTLRRIGQVAGRLEEAAGLSFDEVRRRLALVRGVGPWTVEETLGHGLGDPDAAPPGDYHLPDTVAWALAREPRADDARMMALLEPFRGQRWRVLRLLMAAGVRAPRYGAPAGVRPPRR